MSGHFIIMFPTWKYILGLVSNLDEIYMCADFPFNLGCIDDFSDVNKETAER